MEDYSNSNNNVNNKPQPGLVFYVLGIAFVIVLLAVQTQLGVVLSNNLSLEASSKFNNNSNSPFTAEIPTAQSVFDTQTMVLPSSVKSAIDTIVDEAHEPPTSNHKHISDHNSYLLPTNLVIPQGTSLSILDADAPWDTPHPHTVHVVDISSKKVVFDSGRLDYTNASKSIVLPSGKYILMDTKYPWIQGNITVIPTQKYLTNENLTVGAFYTATNEVKDNKDNDGRVHPGWFGYYQSQFPMNGFQILSNYSFHYAKCKYCPGGYWPDIKSADNTLFVYNTSQPLSKAIAKLSKFVWDNVYI